MDLRNGKKLSFSDTNFGRNAWGVPAFGRGPWGQSRVRGEKDVIFKFDPEESINDQVSGQPLITTLPAGRPLTGYSTFGENVPMIDNEGWLNSYSAYINLITYSENLAGAGWGKTGITWGLNYFRALVQYGGIFQDIAATQNSYTFSFLSYSLDGPGTTLLVLHEFGDGPTTSPLTISAAPIRYNITVPGKTGGGVMRFGLFDPNPSNWQTIYFFKIILTETPSAMPYLKTISVPVASPENNSSTDRGNKFPIGYIEPPLATGIELNTFLSAVTPIANDYEQLGVGWAAFFDTTINIIAGFNSLWQYDIIGTGPNALVVNVLSIYGLVENKEYEVKMYIRHRPDTGGSWAVFLDEKRVSKAYTSGFNEELIFRFKYLIGISDGLVFKPYNNPAGDGGLYVDSLSIKEVVPQTPWRTCGQNLIDAFDGVGNGSEIVINGSFNTDTDWIKGTGWTITGGEAVANIATGDLVQTNPYLVAEAYYEVIIDLSIYSNGKFKIRLGGGVQSELLPLADRSSIYKLRLTAGISNNLIEINIEPSSFTGSINSISIKQISNAEGELFIEWQPTFNSVDILTDFLNIGSIISQYYGFPNILTLISLLVGPTIFITADELDQASLSLSFKKDTIYYCRIIWGVNPSEGPNKMQLIIDETNNGEIVKRVKSLIIDFSGRFPISEFLSFEYLGLFLNKTRKTLVYNKPQSW